MSATFPEAKSCREQKRRLNELKAMPIPEGALNCLSGFRFVLTGILPSMTRAKAKLLIEQYGGTFESDITPQTNVILKGYNEEKSKKLKEAKSRGITITDQEGLFSFIASTNSNNPDIEQTNSEQEEISEISEYINKMTKLQQSILNFLDDSQNVEENYQQFLNIIDDNPTLKTNKNELSDLLHLLTTIINNHYHFHDFYSKIYKIILYFKDEITAFYTNSEIFRIFNSNKRILLFLLQEKMIKFDKYIIKQITRNYKYIKEQYQLYFAPEIKEFTNEKWFPYNYLLNEELKKELTDDFFENRMIGENENEICKLIQKDLIKEFIVYINKNNLKLDSTINQSKYETNLLLLKSNKISLIEYAAFYGSIQIINYLLVNNVKLTPSLWIYAIHSNNSEIIHILEDNKVDISNDENITYKDCLFEAIKCHHIDVANYLIINFLENEKIDSEEFISYYLKYRNYSFIKNEYINESSINFLCKYDYFNLVKHLITFKNIDINQMQQDKIPLFAAIENENVNIVELLLMSFSDININVNNTTYFKLNEKDDFFHWTNSFGWQSAKEDYQNINDNIKGEITPLFLAIEKENIEIVELLLLYNDIDVNKISKYSVFLEVTDNFNAACIEENTPLHLAIEKENIEIIKLLLLNNKIDVNLNKKTKKFANDSEDHGIKLIDDTPLNCACKNSNAQIVDLLLMNDKIDINALHVKKEIMTNGSCFISKKAPLHTALNKGNIDIIKSIVKNSEVDVNIRYIVLVDQDWLPSIHRVRRYNIHNFTRFFDDDMKQLKLNKSQTPLLMAREKNYSEIIDLLIKKGAKTMII